MRAPSTAPGLTGVLFAALLAIAVASCDRDESQGRPENPRRQSASQSHGERTGAGDTDDDVAENSRGETLGESTGSERDVVSASDGAVSVFFSRCYDNDPVAAASDPASIERSLVRLIASARRTIDCAFFELESTVITDALVAARDRGVRVRMVGESDYRDNIDVGRIESAGIPVVWDERSALMHNKFLVVDDEAVWTGSYNLTGNCAYRNNNNAVLIRSRELAENYRSEFEEMFVDRRFGPRSPSNTPHSKLDVGEASIYNYFSPEDEIPPKIVRFLRVAKRSIAVLAFSFTDTTLANELIARHDAGVDVQVVVEARTSAGRGSVVERLRAAGLDVRIDANRFVMHHKVIVIDTTWTITGSYNFSAAAASSNDENILIIKSAPVAIQYVDEFRRVREMALRRQGIARVSDH